MNRNGNSRPWARGARFAAALALALVGATVPALGTGAGDGAAVAVPPSPVIYPDESVALRFSHAGHATEPCLACHSGAALSTRVGDRLLPDEAHCVRCHAVAAPTAADAPALCGRCHPSYAAAATPPRLKPGATGAVERITVEHPPEPVDVPAAYLVFSHAAHAGRGASCATCHPGVERTALASRENSLPRMPTCLRCHDGRKAPASCRTCHLRDAAGRVRTRLPSGLLKPSGRVYDDAHGPDLLRAHGAKARRARNHCANCHADEACEACHAGIAKPRAIHPNDWMLLHPAAARRNEPNCDACHRGQSFCLTCHRRTGVARVGNPGFPEGMRHHPADWADRSGLAATNRHGAQAQRNVRACVACHAERDCTACHRADGAGLMRAPARTHPDGFTQQCRALRARNERACAKCHAAGDPRLDRCR